MNNIEQNKMRKMYCRVVGCGNYTNRGKGLLMLPKNVDRAKEWLKAAGLGHMVEQLPMITSRRASIRFCKRHFLPTSFLNKVIAEDAVPRLYLPEPDKSHHGVLCKNCETIISGIRYKCIVCEDYDLCKACENQNEHNEHNMMRITKPVSNIDANDIVRKMAVDTSNTNKVSINHLSAEPVTIMDIDSDNSDATSDDEPITKYMLRNHDCCDLPEEVKSSICHEINRVLSTINKTHSPKPLLNRQSSRVKHKKFNISTQTTEDDFYPEVEFADVNDSDFQADIKSEDVLDMAPESVPESTDSKLYNLLAS